MNISESPSDLLSQLPTEELRKRINDTLANGLTGQVQVISQTEKSLTLFVCEGKVRQFYISNHRAPDVDWEVQLAKLGNGELKIEALPARTLMFRKILLERRGTVTPQPSSTNQLKTMFDYAMQNPAPTLFQIHWASAEGFVLFAGKDIPHRRAILLKENGASEGSVAFDQIRSWEETGCTVTVYRGNIQSQAWLEVFLNILLEHYCSKILNQYGILTGKVMIHAILWKVHTMAVEEGWNVGTQNSELTDATLFPTAREAGDAYKKIIAEAANHVEPVIGHALTWSILSQTFNASRGIYKTIAEVFGLLGAAPA